MLTFVVLYETTDIMERLAEETFSDEKEATAFAANIVLSGRFARILKYKNGFGL